VDLALELDNAAPGQLDRDRVAVGAGRLQGEHGTLVFLAAWAVPAMFLLMGCRGHTVAASASSTELAEEEEHLSPTAGTPNNICRFSAPQCATERWGIKIGIDDKAGQVNLVDMHPHSISDLRSESVPGQLGACTPRFAGLEEEIVELRNVRLVCLKHEAGSTGDKDYHLVLEDPSDPETSVSSDPTCQLLNPRAHDISSYETVIAEIPDPSCLDPSNSWQALIRDARSVFDSSFSPGQSPKRVSQLVSLRGVRFFDVVHGQLGVAPNGIEIHPVLSFCVGQDCVLGQTSIGRP
jgi:hypothetical protein